MKIIFESETERQEFLKYASGSICPDFIRLRSLDSCSLDNIQFWLERCRECWERALADVAEVKEAKEAESEVPAMRC